MLKVNKSLLKKIKSKNILCFLCFILIAILIVICISKILCEKINDYDNEKIYDELRTTIDSLKNDSNSPYLSLFELNSDMVGWIRIDGTTINYPVMQSEIQDYYLNHNFYKEYSVYGVPYVPSECDVNKPSDNIIIYGHHIKGGKMFSALDKYKNKSFYSKHKYINFNTLYECGLYEIIAVFKTTVYNETGFKYYTFTDAESEEEFDAYVTKCKKLSLYECYAEAEYGDKLITLSTCEYSQKNGRLIIVAKKIIDKNSCEW